MRSGSGKIKVAGSLLAHGLESFALFKARADERARAQETFRLSGIYEKPAPFRSSLKAPFTYAELRQGVQG